MPTIYCYSGFKKRKRSTAVPSGTGTSISVTLKDGTSQYYPTFVLSGAYPSYNYVKWGSFYYYVSDIVQITNNIYEMECKIDPWGTARSDILNSTQFVNRSASSYNIWMKDIEVSNEQRVVNIAEETTLLQDSGGNMYFADDTYLLRTISGDPNGTTGSTTYVLDEGQLKVALNWLFTSNNVFDAAWDTVVKSIFNPFQYVLSLKYTPIPTGYIPGVTDPNNTKVCFGWWQYTAGTAPKHLSGTGTAFPPPGSPITLKVPSPYFNDFRDYDPDFTEYRLLLPGGNMVTLPSILMNQTIYVTCVCDFITNKAILSLDGGTSGYITSFEFDCCCDIQISQTAADFSSTVSNVSTGISSAIAKHPAMLGASIAGAVTSLLQPIPSTSGNQGNMTFLRNLSQLSVTAIRYGSGSYPTNRCGRILNAPRTISTLSGFCKCSEAAVDTILPDDLTSEIEAGMNSGFYIE